MPKIMWILQTIILKVTYWFDQRLPVFCAVCDAGVKKMNAKWRRRTTGEWVWLCQECNDMLYALAYYPPFEE